MPYIVSCTCSMHFFMSNWCMCHYWYLFYLYLMYPVTWREAVEYMHGIWSNCLIWQLFVCSFVVGKPCSQLSHVFWQSPEAFLCKNGQWLLMQAQCVIQMKNNFSILLNDEKIICYLSSVVNDLIERQRLPGAEVAAQMMWICF